jgi:hypothetical protein
MRPKEIVVGLGRFGPTTQATVAGIYAWATTLVPVAWSRSSPFAAKAAAVGALAALGAGWVGSRRWGPHVRIAAMWGFVLSCALGWSVAHGALAPRRLDPFRGLTGTLAWALFAFAWAAPAMGTTRGTAETQADTASEPLAPRRRTVGAEGYLLLGAGVLAAAIQAIGWDVPGVERSLLVRFAALAAGLAILDAAVVVALAQYPRRARASASARLKASRAWLLVLGALALLGAVAAIRG